MSNSITVPLPATKSYAHRRVIWWPVTTEPAVGVIEVQEANYEVFAGARHSRYAVLEEPLAGALGRRFRVTKPGDGSEFYYVYVTAPPAHSCCDCTGNLQHSHCKHQDALEALVKAGHLGSLP